MSKKLPSAGFTVLELSVSLMVVAILMAAVGTGIYATVLDARDKAVLDQLDRIKKAIVGEPWTTRAGESLIRHGYLGDMGNLPATLSALVTQGTQATYQVDATTQIGAGWRGPYLPNSFSDLTVDPWGQGIVYTVAADISAVTGAPTVATIRSIGPDGKNGTADDRVVEIYRSEAFSTVSGYVKDASGLTVSGIGVQISYPINGTLLKPAATATTDSNGLYKFQNVPLGARVIQVSPHLSYKGNTAITTGSGGNNVQFTVQNLGQNATTITSMTVTYNTNPPAKYSQVKVDGSSVFTGTAVSGTTIFFTRTVAGTGVIQEPFRIDVANLYMQVPDILIGTVGAGGTLDFQLLNFTTVGSSSPQDMTGVTFVVQFSDGSIIQFTPTRPGSQFEGDDDHGDHGDDDHDDGDHDDEH